MTTSAERIRACDGPAILSFGFRPFFLMAGLWAAAAMVLWIAMLSGRDSPPTAFDPVAWHGHELLFGFLSAVMARFLLTAVPNWTKRLPITGWALAGLSALWLAGRAAVALSANLPGRGVDPRHRPRPCLVWTGGSFRLGWGGGYFDRTLAMLTPRPFTNGIVPCAARLSTIYPQPHDIPFDLILTEDGVAATSAEARTDR